MKAFLLFTVLFVSALFAVSIDSEEENFIEVKLGTRLKYYDSDGVEVSVPLENTHHRSVREEAGCKYPENETGFYLDCKMYLNRITCTQTCTFGTTLKEGIQREMKCMYDGNNWTPSPTFEKCQPFIDCTLTLKPGGKYKCYINDLKRGPVCEISCTRYEDKPAVRRSSYACDIEGNWTPKLPRCAKAGSGLKLVPPPTGRKKISRP